MSGTAGQITFLKAADHVYAGSGLQPGPPLHSGLQQAEEEASHSVTQAPFASYIYLKKWTFNQEVKEWGVGGVKACAVGWERLGEVNGKKAYVIL